jgi:hypothetical protein
VLRSPRLLAPVGICTMLVWSLEYVVYLAMMRGFAIDLPAWSALLALVVTNIGIAAPRPRATWACSRRPAPAR